MTCPSTESDLAHIDTEQRSDTSVNGGGDVFIYKGTGAGSSNISSDIKVIRDIWLRDDLNKEHHLRYNFDIPVRKGQKISQISLSGDSLRSPIILMSILNHNTKDWWWLSGNEPIALSDKKYGFWRTAFRWYAIFFVILFMLNLFDIIRYDLEELWVLAFFWSAPTGFIVWFFCSRENKKKDKKYVRSMAA